jgi:hypothetical protein
MVEIQIDLFEHSAAGFLFFSRGRPLKTTDDRLPDEHTDKILLKMSSIR